MMSFNHHSHTLRHLALELEVLSLSSPLSVSLSTSSAAMSVEASNSVQYDCLKTATLNLLLEEISPPTGRGNRESVVKILELYLGCCNSPQQFDHLKQAITGTMERSRAQSLRLESLMHRYIDECSGFKLPLDKTVIQASEGEALNLDSCTDSMEEMTTDSETSEYCHSDGESDSDSSTAWQEVVKQAPGAPRKHSRKLVRDVDPHLRPFALFHDEGESSPEDSDADTACSMSEVDPESHTDNGSAVLDSSYKTPLLPRLRRDSSIVNAPRKNVSRISRPACRPLVFSESKRVRRF
jgi:hypothetical protein